MVQMLMNAVANLTNALRMKLQHDAYIAYLHIPIADVSLMLLFSILCPISLFSVYFLMIVRIRPVFFGNVNTNASESLQTSYDHYKCIAINKNGVRLLTNKL